MPSGTPRDNAAPVPPVAIPATMRAVVAERYGGIEALRVTERQRPDIASDEVLVQVYAAGLDRGQLHLLNGEPYLLRLAQILVTVPEGADSATEAARDRKSVV